LITTNVIPTSATPLPGVVPAYCQSYNASTKACELKAPTPSELGLTRRDSPLAKIFWDRAGHIKLIMPFVITSPIAQAFENSGYSLTKDLFNEARLWILNAQYTANNLASPAAAFCDWSGQFDYKSRYLGDLLGTTANYATVAIKVDSSLIPSNAPILANSLALWLIQGRPAGNLGVNVNVVADAFAQGLANGPHKRLPEPESGKHASQTFLIWNGTI
jgi:hypothetical protein